MKSVLENNSIVENNFDGIEISSLSVEFDGRSLLSDFNLRVKKGECIGLFAPTGRGKTTLLNKITEKYAGAGSKISYAFQDNRLILELSAYQNVKIPLENIYTEDKAEKIANYFISQLDLQSVANNKCKKLSGGEKQRVNLARAFAYDGDIFLLDEPFSAQDEKHKKTIFELIENLIPSGKSVIIVSHNKNDLDLLCERIVKL